MQVCSRVSTSVYVCMLPSASEPRSVYIYTFCVHLSCVCAKDDTLDEQCFAAKVCLAITIGLSDSCSQMWLYKNKHEQTVKAVIFHRCLVLFDLCIFPSISDIPCDNPSFLSSLDPLIGLCVAVYTLLHYCRNYNTFFLCCAPGNPNKGSLYHTENVIHLHLVFL